MVCGKCGFVNYKMSKFASAFCVYGPLYTIDTLKSTIYDYIRLGSFKGLHDARRLTEKIR